MNRRRFAQHLAATVGALSFGRATSRRGSLSGAVPAGGGRPNQPASRRSCRRSAGIRYGGVSRVAYSEFDRQGREWAMGVMREAGLTVSIDAAGNIIGRRAGRNPSLKPIVFGSHIDSVPEGGNYDGDVGSLGAIEVARTLARTSSSRSTRSRS